MFRTIRLYDHGQAYPRDKVYDYFTAQNPDGTVAGARVNPLSDVTNVLVAAVEDTPLDYWVASRDPSSDVSLMQNNSFTKKISQADWKAFRGVWAQCLIRARSLPGKNISNSLGLGLSDVYGDWDKFGWYSAGNPKKIFSAPGVAPASVSTIPGLHEIDRKMLFSFSLDSFSDRQQLFLYILRAESTVPSFGGGQQEGGMKSLAGGRAVALVWRDPYPTGFDKASPDGYPKKDYLTPNRVSPWYQVNRKKYDDSMEAYSQDAATSTRTTGFNEHRILFFKQLDN